MSEDEKRSTEAVTAEGSHEPHAEPDASAAHLDEPPDRSRLIDLGGRLRSRPNGLLFGLACVTIVLYGMRHSRAILAPIFLAMFIVMALSPIMQWLRRKGMPPWAALLVVLAGFLVVAAGFIAIVATSLGQISSRIPVYQQGLSRVTSTVQVWFAGHDIDISGVTGNILRPDKIIGWVNSSVRMFISLLSSAFLVALIVVFMIAEVYSFPRKLHEDLLLGPRLGRAFDTFGTVTRTFLFTLTWLNALTAALVAVVYYAFGVEFALLWALLFFLLSFIPNIGFVLAVIPPFFVTLLGYRFRSGRDRGGCRDADQRSGEQRHLPAVHGAADGADPSHGLLGRCLVGMGAGTCGSSHGGAPDAHGETSVLRIVREHTGPLQIHDPVQAKEEAQVRHRRGGIDSVRRPRLSATSDRIR